MLSVGAIRFENRFCASRKGGTGEVGGSTALADRASWLWQLAIEFHTMDSSLPNSMPMDLLSTRKRFLEQEERATV